MSDGQPIRVAVLGAAGRMGREVLRSLTPAYGFDIRIAVDRGDFVGANCRELAGPNAPDLVLQNKVGAAFDETPVDVVVDFSHHSAVAAHAESALKRKISPVIGCTGMSNDDVRGLRALTREHETPAMIIPNFAIGAVLMMKFSELAAQWLPDAEIIELHHDRKEDAPSGTAMLTADMIGNARKQEKTRLPRTIIKAEGARGGMVHDVPVHSIRLPGLLAHQKVMFGGLGEVLSIQHDSMDRTSFMPGVRLAAQRVQGLTGLVIGLDKILFAE